MPEILDETMNFVLIISVFPTVNGHLFKNALQPSTTSSGRVSPRLRIPTFVISRVVSSDAPTVTGNSAAKAISAPLTIVQPNSSQPSTSAHLGTGPPDLPIESGILVLYFLLWTNILLTLSEGDSTTPDESRKNC